MIVQHVTEAIEQEVGKDHPSAEYHASEDPDRKDLAPPRQEQEHEPPNPALTLAGAENRAKGLPDAFTEPSRVWT